MEYKIHDSLMGYFNVKLQISNVVPITKIKRLKNKCLPTYNKKIINVQSLAPMLLFEYEPSSNAACITRFFNYENKCNGKLGNHMKITEKNSFLVHATGAVICPGRKDINEIDTNFAKYLEIMKNVKQPFYRYDPQTLKPLNGYPRHLPLVRYIHKNTEISNIVVTCIFPHKYIHLDEIKRKYFKRAKYEPFKFPALDMKFFKFDIFEFGVTYQIYSSGKINILGLVNKYQLDLAFKKLIDIISDSHRTYKTTELDMAWKYTYLNIDPKLISNDLDFQKKNNSNVYYSKGESAPTPYERQLKFKRPEYFGFIKYGVRLFKNPHVNILRPIDFIDRAHEIYLK